MLKRKYQRRTPDNSEYGHIKTALRRFKRADANLRRANNSGDGARMNKAGTGYAMAKANVFHLMQLFSI